MKPNPDLHEPDQRVNVALFCLFIFAVVGLPLAALILSRAAA